MEDAWNSKKPKKVVLAYTINTESRNRINFIIGRAVVSEFFKNKWNTELDYKLKKELWGFTENIIAVRFEYEYRSEKNEWFRAYGNENGEFDNNGQMKKRYASINDLVIKESDRKL